MSLLHSRHYKVDCLQSTSKQSLRRTALNLCAYGVRDAGIQLTIYIPVLCSMAQRLLRTRLQADTLAMTNLLTHRHDNP